MKPSDSEPMMSLDKTGDLGPQDVIPHMGVFASSPAEARSGFKLNEIVAGSHIRKYLFV
jgi:hypothetical protein